MGGDFWLVSLLWIEGLGKLMQVLAGSREFLPGKGEWRWDLQAKREGDT